MPDYSIEKTLNEQGFKAICGVDEAGRGPLAGPVCAAAVILPLGFEIVGLNDSKKLSEKKREAIFEVIKEKEAERILPNLNGFVFAMAIEGEKFSSENFAKKIKNLTDDGVGEITFVIGGSYGLSDKVKKKANKLISFSDMTFPHTLFRLMLTEQVYRAFCIINGSAYHK